MQTLQHTQIRFLREHTKSLNNIVNVRGMRSRCIPLILYKKERDMLPMSSYAWGSRIDGDFLRRDWSNMCGHVRITGIILGGEKDMNRQSYIKMNTWFEKHPKAGSFVCLANLICTRLIYVCYPVLLVSLLIRHDPAFLRSFIVPAVSFVILSVVRGWINAPRPYEKYGVKPLIPKETKGNSFPSRHVFSAFVIAMTGFYSNPLIGTLILIPGLIIAVCRVLGGVHFPGDVIAGALLGIAAGWIGLFLF